MVVTGGAADLSRPWLVADIGGTNARFALVDGASGVPRDIQRVRCADYPGPVEAAASYLAGQQAAAGAAWAAPRWAAFAVATPVGSDRIDLTNSAWCFSRAESEAALGLDGLLMLNDFEALALSLPGLGPHQLRAHGPLPSGQGTLAVIGPGTGLGVGGLLDTGRGWRAIAGEGGHATLAAADDFEAEILRVVRAEHEHVSAERLLSGIGLPLLYRALAQVRGEAAQALAAEDIGSRGADGSDALCAATLATFCAMLGGFAGNVVLTFGARGGLYIGGGIVPRFADFFFASDFRARFEAKGRFRAYLEAVPTALIVEPYAALHGAAAAIETRLRETGITTNPGSAA
ncbi:glucokinase [Rubrivivax gelatinosus]|nr:glucokinase [Rubrivivax gelatinosus]